MTTTTFGSIILGDREVFPPYLYEAYRSTIKRAPRQPPVDVPLVLGGNSEKALRRAVRLGDAWFSSGTPSFEDAARLRDRVAQLCAEQGRDPLRCYFRSEKWDAETIDRYHAEGITDLVIWADQVWPAGDLAEKRRSLAQAAERLGLEPAAGTLDRTRP